MNAIRRALSGAVRRREVQLSILAAFVTTLMGQGCPSLNTNTNTGGDDNGTPSLTGKYAGSESCYTCHANRHDDWSQTRHASSLNTLKTLGQDTNPVCITCHTTGYGDDGGFVDLATTPQLASVGCESCHGPSRSHTSNVADKTLRPPVKVDAGWCARCHNGFHHDTFSEWEDSGHGTVVPDEAIAFSQGKNLNSCGTCHSGDFRLAKLIQGQTTVSDSLLAGVDPKNMNGISCAICHNPHKNTGNAENPPANHDFQLRYKEISELAQSNVAADTSNQERFGLCGQCHHDRGATWTGTSRPSHHSIQGNFYRGEMPTPDGTASLVPNTNSVHRFVQKQCVTCHMQADDVDQDFTSNAQPYVRHTFHVDRLGGCVTSACHPSTESVEHDKETLAAEVEAKLAAIKTRLGAVNTWEYSSAGGPTNQSTVSEAVKKVRFMYYYVSNDGSKGTHNPAYARAILTQCDTLLKTVGK